MSAVLLGRDLALDLQALLADYRGRPRHEPDRARGSARTIPNRAVIVKVAGRPGADDAPQPDWQPAAVVWTDAAPDAGPGHWVESEEQVWVLPLNGARCDVGVRYPATCVGVFEDGRLVYGVLRTDKLWGVMHSRLVEGGSAFLRVRGDADDLLWVQTKLLSPGETVEPGTQVAAYYDQADQTWYLDGAQCPTGGGDGGPVPVPGPPKPPDEPPPPPPPPPPDDDGGKPGEPPPPPPPPKPPAPAMRYSCADTGCHENPTGEFASLDACQNVCQTSPQRGA